MDPKELIQMVSEQPCTGDVFATTRTPDGVVTGKVAACHVNEEGQLVLEVEL